MREPRYISADYDPERRSYVSVAAGWGALGPTCEYRFTLLEDDEHRGRWQGGLEKVWLDEKGNEYSEFYAFAEYPQQEAFEVDVAAIRDTAKQRTIHDNLDEFLAVIDVVKKRGIEAGFMEERLDELEGLFEDGPEDAYSLREWEDGPRLHDHVDCEDECWYLRVAQVVDEQQQSLGWGVFAVHFPGLPSQASLEERQQALQARVLLVEHHASQRDALMAKDGILTFMETERVENPELAYENDTDILESISTGADPDVDSWLEYTNAALQDFLRGTVVFTYARQNWQPPQQSPVDAFFARYPQPIWLEDQLRSMLDAKIGLEADEDSTSPWQQLDLG